MPRSSLMSRRPTSVRAVAEVGVLVAMLIWAMIETPAAIFNAREIASHPRVAVLVMGTNDLVKELRAVLTDAELQVRGGAQARVSPFADGFDGAALLQRAGFALPVADVDRVTVRYPDLLALFRDLRAMGETNVLAGPVRPIGHAGSSEA
mgnify:CR=1 FL=1